FPLDEMLNDMVPVSQRHFTKSDIDALTAFYSSPAGQKFLHEMPAVTAETMKAVYPRIQAEVDAASSDPNRRPIHRRSERRFHLSTLKIPSCHPRTGRRSRAPASHSIADKPQAARGDAPCDSKTSAGKPGIVLRRRWVYPESSASSFVSRLYRA